MLRRRLFSGIGLGLLALLIAVLLLAPPVMPSRAIGPSQTPPPLNVGGIIDPAGVPRLPAITGATGRLLIAYNGDVYLAAFDDAPATLLLHNVLPGDVHVSPDGRTLVYVRHDSAQATLFLMRLEDLTQMELKAFVIEPTAYWSPDGEWVALDFNNEWDNTYADTALVANRLQPDQSHLFESMNVVTWLDGNQLLVEQEQADDDPYARGQIAQVDPTTGAVQVVELSEAQGQAFIYTHVPVEPDTIALTAVLNELGFAPVWSLVNIWPPRNATLEALVKLIVLPDPSPLEEGETPDPNPPFAGKQLVRIAASDGQEAVLAAYPSASPISIEQLQWAANGELYYVIWEARTTPEFENLPTPYLKRLVPGETPLTISGPLLNDTTPPLYAIAPTGGFVAWVGHDLEVSVSSLEITDLSNGIQTRLLSLEVPYQPPANQWGAIGFTGVWWVQ